MAVRIFTADQAIHAWDLAKATGRPHQIDETLATETYETMHALLRPEFRGPGKAFGELQPVPDDAPIPDRMLAFSGRRP
jgi:uncharacterized protein (TIGR03086 family)